MKLKRLFTAVLSAALALSLCAMPAMAADGSTAAGTPNTSTIDKGQTGSITIYKRALDGETPGDPGKGEAMEAPGTALKDTGFTLYRVMDTNTLLAYYNDNTTADQVDVKDYFTNYAENKTAAGLKTAIGSRIQRHCLTTIMDFRQALQQRLLLTAALRTKPRIQKKILEQK